ncbi:MAG: valine--pyruvate transaminase [Pseudomonadota bacterium]
MEFSRFGEKFGGPSGISELMDDLATALREDPAPLFMGGGNPGRSPEAIEMFAARLDAIARNGDRAHEMLGVYQPPCGDLAFREELAGELKRRFGWNLTADNIAIANGSQTAVFTIYNMFAGEMMDGSRRHIHLPMSPEYVGYRDTGLNDGFFQSTRPTLRKGSHGFFRYLPDFDALDQVKDIGALSISRPSNPTGGMVSDDELLRLDRLARARKVPLILDGAYGLPFPSLIYTKAEPLWNENTVLLLSLSKLGLPGLRTGIVIAKPEIAEAFARANTVISLATGSLGPMLLRGSLRDGSLERLCSETLKPFYLHRRALALDAIASARGDLPVYVHESDGAFFLWLWCENLPIDSRELYGRLKERGLIVLPGNEFFIGLDQPWDHERECLRLSYAGEPDTIKQGIAILMDELRRCYHV